MSDNNWQCIWDYLNVFYQSQPFAGSCLYLKLHRPIFSFQYNKCDPNDPMCAMMECGHSMTSLKERAQELKLEDISRMIDAASNGKVRAAFFHISITLVVLLCCWFSLKNTFSNCTPIRHYCWCSQLDNTDELSTLHLNTYVYKYNRRQCKKDSD